MSAGFKSHSITVFIRIILKLELFLSLRVDQLIYLGIIVDLSSLELTHDFALSALLQVTQDLHDAIIPTVVLGLDLLASLRLSRVLDHRPRALGAP